MVLEIYKTDDGHVPGIEYLPYSEESYITAFCALTVRDGLLMEAGADDPITYISMAAKGKDGILPVVRVDRNTVYKAECPVETDPTIGGKLMNTTGGFVGDEGGSFEIVGILEDGVLVRLV